MAPALRSLQSKNMLPKILKGYTSAWTGMLTRDECVGAV